MSCCIIHSRHLELMTLEPASLAQVKGHWAWVDTRLLAVKLYIVLAGIDSMVSHVSCNLVPVNHVISQCRDGRASHGRLTRKAALQGQSNAPCQHNLRVASMNKIYFDWYLFVWLSMVMFGPCRSNYTWSLGLILVVYVYVLGAGWYCPGKIFWVII